MKVIFLTLGLQLTLCFFRTAGANEWASCEGRCGARFDRDRTKCHCNYACVTHNDCCADFLQNCTRIHLDGNNPLEGLVIVEEKEKEKDAGYICHNGLWLSWEVSAACADLGYDGGVGYSADTSLDVGSLPILHSYVTCGYGAMGLNQCEFITNVTTQKLCETDETAQDGCCKGLLGVRCTNQTDDEMTTTSTTVQIKTDDNDEPSTKLIRAEYIYIIIGAVCALLITGVVLVVVVRSRSKGRKQLRNPPATDDPTVAMGNATSVQSADPTYTGVIYKTDEGGEDEYTYVDVPPIHSPSEDLQHTYMDPEVLLVTSRNISSDDNSCGLIIDNVPYKKF